MARSRIAILEEHHKYTKCILLPTFHFFLSTFIVWSATAFKSSLSLYFLMGILISSAIQEFDFIIGLINDIFFDSFEHQMFIFSRRMAWASVTLQYQFLGLFLESIVTKKFTLKLRHKIFTTISFLFAVFFVGIAIIDIGRIRMEDKYLFEFFIQKIT